MVLLYIVRFMNGLAYGFISTATNTIVTAYIPEDKKGKGINYYGLSTSLAAALGPFVGMALLNFTNFNTIILFIIALSGTIAIVSFIFPVKNIILTNAQRKTMRSFNIHGFIEEKATFIATIAFFMGISYSSVLTFLSSYSHIVHLEVAGSFFFVIYALVITISRPLTGQIFDSKGERYVMYPSYLFLTLGLMLLSISSSGWLLLLSGGIIGLGYGTFMSNGQAICLKLSTEDRIGISLSTYFIGLDLGLGVGPYIMGSIKTYLSYNYVYAIASILPIICFLLYYINYRRKLQN